MKQPCHLPEETGVQLLCAASYDIWCRDLDNDQTSTEQTLGRTDQNGKKYAQHNIIKIEGPTSGSGRGQTHRCNLHCEKMKWSWAGHINRLKDDRWTSCDTAWRPYDKKRLQGRPAKRWRDDLDKYWSDTIWQRTAQDRVIWRRHAEAYAQPRDTTAA